MKLDKLDQFLDSKISVMSAGEYLQSVNEVIFEFNSFHSKLRRSNKDLLAQMRSLKSQGACVDEFIRAGLPISTSMRLVALLTNTKVYIQLER